jgi:hypothetical protein
VFFWRRPQDLEPHLRTAEVAEDSSLNLVLNRTVRACWELE